ncbi:hypothetical protein QQ020_35635 [Fulvivirgaceae bacterium BMA12]|uniref:Phage protein n=1 Tax=Agaribacillus aureus TaxID=3051825 RepID=A0ABT8LI25_9BACT|nr:hypothetical protein [Fulvivirgaceae bacterium BMA12]
MAVYSLDKALEILFDDRKYYLSLSQTERSKIRKYKQRYKENTLTLDGKISLIKMYGGEVIEDIKVKLK